MAVDSKTVRHAENMDNTDDASATNKKVKTEQAAEKAAKEAAEQDIKEQEESQPWPTVGLDGDDPELQEQSTTKAVDPIAEWQAKAEEQQKKQSDGAGQSVTPRG